MIPKFLSLLLAFLAAWLLMPGDALAWGPGVHIAIGNGVLGALKLIAPSIAQLLAEHGRSFLYGCVSADIFIGKGSAFKPGHSHNWRTGFDLLRSVRRPELRAYAYGYLTHLAADTVAHNYFVPNLLGTLPLSGRLGHVYLEMQADRRVSWCSDQAMDIFDLPLNAADRSLLLSMERNPLPFKIKKHLYRGSLVFCSQKTLRSSLSFVDNHLACTLGREYLGGMLDLSARVVLDFLRDPEFSPALALDPIGSDNLARAGRFRRRQNILFRHKGFRPVFPVDAGLLKLPAAAGIPCSFSHDQAMFRAVC
jgi:hypothetical protein